MNKNYVVIDLVKYDELMKEINDLKHDKTTLILESNYLNEKISELEEDREFMAKEIRDILDAIIEDNISYAVSFSSYDITLSSKIAEYLNANDYLELAKEIKRAKLETKLVNDIKEIKEGANNE